MSKIVRNPKIGLVKLPDCPQCGTKLQSMIEFVNGPDYPEDLEDYRTVEVRTCPCGYTHRRML